MIIINLILMPFSELIKSLDKKIIDDMLENFYCERESFIEDFIKRKSYHAETMGSSKSYFILDEDRSDSDHLCALGFYALSLKVWVLKKDISKNNLKKLHLQNKYENHISTYYIALLGKNDIYRKEINGKQIIDCAINTIIEAIKCVGGRVTWVEARKKNQKVIDFYINNGFKVFQTELQDDEEYSHLIRIVKP